MSYTTYLAHHGIKGQKWGVRRFQNYDGTRIKSEKVPIPKGPYFKKVGILNRSSNFWDNHKETQAAKELRKTVSSVSSEVIAKNNADGSRVNSFREWAIANQAQYWSKGFGDERDEYVKLYHEYTERVDQHNFNSDVNEIRSKLDIPSNAGAVVYKIIDSAIEQEYDKTIYKPALDNDEHRKKRNVFDDLYHDTSITSDSPEVQSAYADILRKGKSIYDKEYKLLNLVEIAAKTPLTTEENQNYQKLIKDLGYDYVECDPIFDPIATIADVKKELKEVSHSVIVNDDIYPYQSYLAHHGIKGQKWGVRRFQKADGSLTAAGAKRYGIKSAMSAGRKVGAGLVKAARGGIQKAKEVKARKAAEKLERQKKVWAKTRLGLTMNADKFTVEELREANNRLDERDRAARGLAAQVERGVGYFKAIRDVTGAIRDTKDYIEDISGEKERKQKAADELKYQRQLEKEERDHQRALEKDKLSAERDIDYKREKDQLDRESRERISKYTVDAKNQKSDSDTSGASAKPDKPNDPSDDGDSSKIRYKGYEFDREFLKKTNPEVYKAATDEEASRNRQEAAQKRALDRIAKETESSSTTASRETRSDESPKTTKPDKADSDSHVDQHRVEKYREFAKNIDASDLSADDKVKYKKSFYSKVKGFKGDTEEFNLETERTLDIAKGLKKSADNRKAAEARQKAEAEANREETTEERQKRKVAESKAYGAEAQYQANMSQLNSMSDSQLAKMAVRRKTSEVVDTVKSFNPKAMAEKYLASGERKRQEQEAKRIAEMSVENLEQNYKAMAAKFGQDTADRTLTEYTEKARSSVAGKESKYGFVGKTYKPDERRMAKDRQELQNHKAQEQIDSNIKDIKKYRKDAERYAGESYGIGRQLYENTMSKINKLEEENRKLRESIKHSDISAYGAYLEHHGIKGQKWGVRRFQNEDGTLTKAGMKRAGYKFKTLRKNATTSRVLIDENEDTSKLDRAYFSTNNLDNQKWANYFASIGAQYLDKSAFAVNFKTKKKLIIARGEEISKVASKLMDEDDTFRKEFEATRQKQIQSTGSEEAWESLSESAKYSAMIAYKCKGGKKIINAMKEIGFDGVEDLFGKDVSKDPIIIFNPGDNLRQVGKKQELKGLYRGYRKYYGLPINHSALSCHNISNSIGGSMTMFANDDLLVYGAYLEHHGIKGQKWGVRRFQNYDGTRISSRIRSSIQAHKYASDLNKLERKKKKSADRTLREYNNIRSLMNAAKEDSTKNPFRALKLLDMAESRLGKYERMRAEDEKREDEIIKKQKAILSELKKNGFEYTAPKYRVKLGSDKIIKFA